MMRLLTLPNSGETHVQTHAAVYYYYTSKCMDSPASQAPICLIQLARAAKSDAYTIYYSAEFPLL